MKGAGRVYLLLIAAATSSAGAQGLGLRPVAITHVNVVDVSAGRVVADRTVVLQGNRIQSVQPAASAKYADGARVIDGQGKFLIPGLWDMHVHATTPGLDRLFLPLLVVQGVTGVREMFSHVEWMDSSRALVQRGDIMGPRVIGSGHILDGKPAIWPGSVGVGSADEARRAVDSLLDKGAAFIKVYSRLTRDEFFAVADEAKKRHAAFAGHVPSLVGAGEASDAGMLTIEHLQQIAQACSSREDELLAQYTAAVASPKGWDSAGVVGRAQATTLVDTYSAPRCTALAKRFMKNGTWMVPTLAVLHSVAYLDDTTLAQDPRLKYVPKMFAGMWNPKNDFRFRMLTPADWAARKRVYERQLEIAKLLHATGVRFLPGTDLSNPYIYPGFSLHDELASFVGIGFTPAEALRSATLEPARFFHATDSLGTVAPGKIADLVLLEANPLLDIRNTTRIHTVIANGRVVSPEDREAVLSKAAQGPR
ncbi:MAG: amidohydrolase family protein [Gemmatimonadaceae bacterium]